MPTPVVIRHVKADRPAGVDDFGRPLLPRGAATRGRQDLAARGRRRARHRWAGRGVDRVRERLGGPGARGVIDDIEVSTGEGPTSFETDLGGWEVIGPPLGSAPNPNNVIRTTAAGFPDAAVVAAPGSLYTGFGFEGITDGAVREQVMGRVLDHLLDLPAGGCQLVRPVHACTGPNSRGAHSTSVPRTWLAVVFLRT